MSASRRRIATLLEKEARELVASRMLLATVVLVPLVFAIISLGIAWASGELPASSPNDARDLEEMRRMMGDRIAHVTSMRDAMQIYLGQQGLLLLLLVPATLPPILAAQTLVREKQARTLETLLVTPVRTWELVLAKVSFTAGLGVVPQWITTIVYFVLLSQRCSPVAVASLVTPSWLVLLSLGTPLLATLGVGLGVAISSRAKDAQTAQQVAGVVVLPVVALLVMQSVGVAALDGVGASIFVGILAVADTLVLALAISLFERETVVTQWK